VSYYDRRSKEDMAPRPKHFQKEWIDACEGDCCDPYDCRTCRNGECDWLLIVSVTSNEETVCVGQSVTFMVTTEPPGLLSKEHIKKRAAQR